MRLLSLNQEDREQKTSLHGQELTLYINSGPRLGQEEGSTWVPEASARMGPDL